LLCLCLVLALSTTARGASGENAPDGVDECAKIADNAERLACYDERTGRGPAGKDAESYLSRLWDLDTGSRRKGFALRPHRFNYILPYTYNATPGKDTGEGKSRV